MTNCLQCGKAFEAKRPHAKLCSARCRVAASRAARGSVTGNVTSPEVQQEVQHQEVQQAEVQQAPVPWPETFQTSRGEIPAPDAFRQFARFFGIKTESEATDALWLGLLKAGQAPGFSIDDLVAFAGLYRKTPRTVRTEDQVKKFFAAYGTPGATRRYPGPAREPDLFQMNGEVR